VPGEGAKRSLGSDLDTCINKKNNIMFWLTGEGANRRLGIDCGIIPTHHIDARMG